VTVARPSIRLSRPEDLEALYDICLRTGAAGSDASDLMAEHRLLGDLFVAPYAVLEPEHAFVVDDGTGAAAGYVVGALDTAAFEARCEQVWWPNVRARYPVTAGARGLDALFTAYLHGRAPTDPELLATYPSHLHIDLLPPFQSGGWGRRLMETLLEALRADGSPGVHLGMSAANERAIGFYRHLGFTQLHADDVTYSFGMLL
jgi:ribosomal protein S18 acetylase RimI-like enzyme